MAILILYALIFLNSIGYFLILFWNTNINSILITILAIVLGILATALFYAITFFIYILIARKLKPGNKLNSKILHGYSNLVLHFTNVKLKVYGKENIKKGETYFFAPNHKSMMDIVTMYNIVATGFVAKKEVLNMPLIKNFFKTMGVVTIDRENDREAAKSLIQASKYLKNGINMCVFPEGGIKTRETDEIIDVKAGAFKIAYKAEVPIIPISFINNRLLAENCPKKKTNVYCKIHKPILYSEYKDLTTFELGEMISKIVNDGIKELNEGVK